MDSEALAANSQGHMGCACLSQQRNGDGGAGSSLVLSATEVVVLESLLGDRWSLQCLSSRGPRAHLLQVHSRSFLSKACFLETIVAVSGRPQYIANTATVPLWGHVPKTLHFSWSYKCSYHVTPVLEEMLRASPVLS